MIRTSLALTLRVLLPMLLSISTMLPASAHANAPANAQPNVQANVQASAGAGAPAGDPKAGAAAFRVCASCHQVGAGARNAFGPHLNGLFGRRAGSMQYAYSAAMKKSPVVWNDKTLAAFLRDPDDVVPGTKMRLWGYSDERKIANLLAYLRQYQ